MVPFYNSHQGPQILEMGQFVDEIGSFFKESSTLY
jgi:hypothetical protein